MRILFIACCVSITFFSFAQKTVDVTNGDVRVGASTFNVVNGTPFVNTKFVRLVEGTPYFSEEWMKAVLVGTDDYSYKNQVIKLDLFDNEVHYRDEKENEMITTTPLKELVLTDAQGNNYRFVKGSSMEQTSPQNRSRWFMWMVSGPATLYKLFEKRVFEQTPYNSATTEQHIKTNEKYMVLYNNSLTEIKKLKDAPSVLANKKNELEEFLKNKDDKNKSMDERFIALVEYYNSLMKSEP
jgi:hypothetical protein